MGGSWFVCSIYSHGEEGYVVVKDIFYDVSTPPPGLPKFVFVDFNDQYTGPSFFPNDPTRRGWFPIYPIKCKYHSRRRSENEPYEEHTRTMLPLKLCWAWTAWKTQGMTIKGKIVAYLSTHEAEHGVTHVMFSRVCKLSDIGLKDGIQRSRLCEAIRKQSKMNRRVREEERLKNLATSTWEKYIN